MTMLYKIAPAELWQSAVFAGVFCGAAVDLADGFIHLSTAAQVEETAAKHFHGQTGLLLIAVEADRLGAALKWEVSRGGALFPHLYATLKPSQVASVHPLPCEGGQHNFTGLLMTPRETTGGKQPGEKRLDPFV